jgi:hypothetical protein
MLSPSTKSESGPEPPVRKWRLRRTLRRTVDYRPIEAEDIKYLWAAYKQGGLKAMGFDDTALSPDEFKAEFERSVVENCHAAWTLFGRTRKGFIPVGFIMAAWAPSGSHLVILCVVWMPWASKRNIVEGAVGFFNGIRKEFSWMGYAIPEHKRMYEVCAMHGIMRRVGTSYVVLPGQACAVFESRLPDKRIK